MKRKKPVKKTYRSPFHYSQLLIFFGVGFILIGTNLYLSYQRTVLSFSAQPEIVTQPAPERNPLPAAIQIPKLDLNLPMEQATIEEGIWKISQNGATHLATSARPGEAGNIIVYGHNKTRIFGKLRELRVGDTIEVTNESSVTTIYEITLRETIAPTVLTYIQPTDHEVLTVYTCTGFLDSERLLFQAKPVSIRYE